MVDLNGCSHETQHMLQSFENEVPFMHKLDHPEDQQSEIRPSVVICEFFHIYWLAFFSHIFFPILLFLCDETRISVHMWEVLLAWFWIIQDQVAKTGCLQNWNSNRHFVQHLGIGPGVRQTVSAIKDSIIKAKLL